jgi:uncharacterized protein YfbU (UPF0304 family)
MICVYTQAEQEHISVATISFRVEDDLKERLDRIVEDRGLNSSHLLREALLDKLAAIEPPGETGTRLPLTIKERLSLALQLRTLRAVCPEGEKPGIEREIEALQSGYEFHYPDLIVAFDSGLSRRACLEVLDILEMFSELNWGFLKLKDKSGIEESDIRFLGFDGNNEIRQMGYAQYFLFDLGRYQSLHEQVKKTGCNSHFPVLDIYRRMVQVFKKLTTPMHPLNADSIKAIVAARRN